MTRSNHAGDASAASRRFRVVWEPEDGLKPWIVQYKSDSPRQWHDVLRFAQYAQATVYAATIRARDQALIEAGR